MDRTPVPGGDGVILCRCLQPLNLHKCTIRSVLPLCGTTTACAGFFLINIDAEAIVAVRVNSELNRRPPRLVDDRVSFRTGKPCSFPLP